MQLILAQKCGECRPMSFQMQAAKSTGRSYGDIGKLCVQTRKLEQSLRHPRKTQPRKGFVPFFGDRNIAAIEAIELLAAVQRVEERGALDVAQRVLTNAGQVWRYAVATARASRDITRSRFDFEAFLGLTGLDQAFHPFRCQASPGPYFAIGTPVFGCDRYTRLLHRFR